MQRERERENIQIPPTMLMNLPLLSPYQGLPVPCRLPRLSGGVLAHLPSDPNEEQQVGLRSRVAVGAAEVML